MVINSINKDIESDVSLFAEDPRILKPVKNLEDVESLQADLEKLYHWQDTNNMKFNRKKFEILSYGTNEDLKHPTTSLRMLRTWLTSRTDW